MYFHAVLPLFTAMGSEIFMGREAFLPVALHREIALHVEFDYGLHVIG